MMADDHTPAQTTTSIYQNGKCDDPGDCAELRRAAWAKRFTGVPPDRASSVARALERAGSCYADEANRDLAVFDSVIHRAMVLDNGMPSVRSNRVGSKATIATAQSSHSPTSRSVLSHTARDRGMSNLTDLMEVLADSTNNCIENQREEIACLRLAVRELILELVQQENRERVPNVIEIQDRSVVDEDSAKGTSVGFQSRDGNGTLSRVRERDFQFISAGTGLSRGTSVSTSRNPSNIEPEGLYTPQERHEGGEKMDPPSSSRKSLVNDLDRSHPLIQAESPVDNHAAARQFSSPGYCAHSFDKNASLEDALHDKLYDVRRRILSSTPTKNDESNIELKSFDVEAPSPQKTHDAYAQGATSGGGADAYAQGATSGGGANDRRSPLHKSPPTLHKAPITPAMARARDLVIERRKRFRNFHLTHEIYAKEHPQTKTPLSQRAPRTPSQKEGLLASLNGEDQQEPLSPLVCLREDELTLMETTAKAQMNHRSNPYKSY
jgi:hypothetical protein